MDIKYLMHNNNNWINTVVCSDEIKSIDEVLCCETMHNYYFFLIYIRKQYIPLQNESYKTNN